MSEVKNTKINNKSEFTNNKDFYSKMSESL